MPKQETVDKTVRIKPPDLRVATFKIIGTAPLVIHRFSQKIGGQLKKKQEEGASASNKKVRTAQNFDEAFEESIYRSPEGWTGFHAAAIRNAMISACRLVGYPMTRGKLSIFSLADGYDATEPQIPLIRIHGEPVRQEDVARVANGNPYITVRGAYHQWHANVKIRWDNDQFTLEDVTNLLMRVGVQVGICEGRPDSKESAGCGWGTFEIETT